jgi:hypothetical protein|tara:strand:+ start:39 stop:161 length:123 start_codon:yes stop_codon:yes gene_type:complete
MCTNARANVHANIANVRVIKDKNRTVTGWIFCVAPEYFNF